MIRKWIRMRTLPIEFLLGHLNLPIVVFFLFLAQLRRGRIFRDALLALRGGWCHGVAVTSSGRRGETIDIQKESLARWRINGMQFRKGDGLHAENFVRAEKFTAGGAIYVHTYTLQSSLTIPRHPLTSAY